MHSCRLAALSHSIYPTVITSRKTALELRSRAVLLDRLPDYRLLTVTSAPTYYRVARTEPSNTVIHNTSSNTARARARELYYERILRR